MTKILITRPLTQGKIFQKQLQDKNIDGVLCPMMSYEKDVNKIGDIDANTIIVTSAHSVSLLKEKNIDPKIKIFAVGNATHDTLISAGFQNIHTGDGTGDYLMRDIIAAHKENPFRKIIHFSGADIATDFITPLSQQGINIERRIIYKAVLTNTLPQQIWDDIASNDIQYITFFSKRVATQFITLAKKMGITGQFSKITCFCISERVKKTLENQNFKSIYIANTPHTDGMIKKICETAPFSDFIKDLGL